MEQIKNAIVNADWQTATAELHEKGYAVLPALIPPELCDELVSMYADAGLYRKTIVMERYRFGKGEYKYFDYPLPPAIQTIREQVYPYLAPVANAWMESLKIGQHFPAELGSLLQRCQANGQTKPTVLMLRYGAGGHNTLHQDLYGEVFFPMQLVIFLTQAGKDHTGGEFVLTQQVPRAQSKAIVLQPAKGDVLVFTTNFRPVKGSKGHYGANMKHGVSEVHAGTRYTLGIIFHDAS
jgi:hypothetical protein